MHGLSAGADPRGLWRQGRWTPRWLQRSLVRKKMLGILPCKRAIFIGKIWENLDKYGKIRINMGTYGNIWEKWMNMMINHAQFEALCIVQPLENVDFTYRDMLYINLEAVVLLARICNYFILFHSEKNGHICIWLVVWNINFIFPSIGLLIIPIDVHIFKRGGPTTNQYMFVKIGGCASSLTLWHDFIWKQTFLF